MGKDTSTNVLMTPFVSPSKVIPEITVRSVFLGIMLGAVLAAANTYLGLYAGLTVSASIPAAVISMGILRGILKRGTILENNIVQTIASTGESLAAGVIFTIPALMLIGLWEEVHFWPTTLICMSGGLLGILFMVPLRKSHIVEDQTLTFPEGVACAEVLKTGEKGGSGVFYLMSSMIAGALLKFFTSGLVLFKGSVEWVWRTGSTGFYMGSDISAALLGVGYIIRFNVAVLVFLGGAIGWLIGIPLIGIFEGAPSPDLMGWFWTSWSTKIRYVGVGAMIVGGIWSIISIWDGMVRGFKEALVGYQNKGKEIATQLRTEVCMSQKHLLTILAITTLLVFGVYQYLIDSVSISAVATVCMIILSFFFVAVASYIVGLVGSSSSPVSGMTICAVLATGGLMLVMGMTGPMGMLATLGVAGVVCCATCTAGDISQDLKTGHILGATPKKQQWMEVVGATIPVMVIAPVLVVLHHAYGIGTGAPGALKAPQASLFAELVKGLFGHGDLPWRYVWWGIGTGIVIIILDQILKAKKAKFRAPIMAVAVGIYLPLTLSTPILLGGIISALVKRRSESDTGVLFASGLIAGEAIIGVLLGAIIYFNKDALPIKVFDSNFVSILALLALGGVLWMIAKKGEAENPKAG